MSRFVIAALKPKPGKQAALEAVVAKHWRLLREKNFVTARAPCSMRAADGTILDVIEWSSPDAIARAHTDPDVQALWSEIEAACDYVPLASLAEAQRPFQEFEPVSN